MVLPIGLLTAAQGETLLVELKDGTSLNGTLVNTDTFMNINLKDVTCTSKEGDRFWAIPECYVRGSTIKYFRLPEEVFDSVPEDDGADRRAFGGSRGRGGAYRGGGGSGFQSRGAFRGGSAAGSGGRGGGGATRGGSRGGGQPYASRGGSRGGASGAPGTRGGRGGSGSGRGGGSNTRGNASRGRPQASE